MAKMFYTLEEAAQKLGKSEDEIKKLADTGKLQQFRDRDKLMFKREQVDQMAASSASGSGEFTLVDDDDSSIKVDTPKPPKAGLKTDAINLDVESDRLDRGKGASATGISVFEAGEVHDADPMAQTQITSGGFSARNTDDELTLDSVGSGSGLLDLTRESDDTSLGAVELLEDIGPGATGAGASAVGQASSGIFDSAGGAESGASNMADLDEGSGFAGVYSAEPEDPAGDGFGGGMLLGVFAVLVVAAIIVVSAMNDQLIGLTRTLAEGQKNFGMYYLLAAVVCIVLGVAGYALGKARA
jgi:hypothetical protein